VVDLQNGGYSWMLSSGTRQLVVRGRGRLVPMRPSPDHVLVTDQGVTTVPAPRDPETERLLRRARDLLAANVLWGYLLEVGRAGCPITLQTVHDVAEGIRLGDLPDYSLTPSSDSNLLSVA
jgi:hypothetical protein